jgi:hypothetical protein
MAGVALELLTDEKILAEAKADHLARMGGKTYSTPLPEGVEVPLAIAEENWEKIPKQ